MFQYMLIVFLARTIEATVTFKESIFSDDHGITLSQAVIDENTLGYVRTAREVF